MFSSMTKNRITKVNILITVDKIIIDKIFKLNKYNEEFM